MSNEIWKQASGTCPLVAEGIFHPAQGTIEIFLAEPSEQWHKLMAP